MRFNQYFGLYGNMGILSSEVPILAIFCAYIDLPTSKFPNIPFFQKYHEFKMNLIAKKKKTLNTSNIERIDVS